MEQTASRRAAYLLGLVAASMLLHVALVLGVGRAGSTAPVFLPQRPLEVAVVEKPAPPPPPVMEPPPAPRRRLVRAPKFAPPPPQQARPVEQPPKAPPPPSVEAKETTQQPVVLPGITLESTTQGGGFAVAAGNTLYGDPPRKAADPVAAKPYKADKYVAAAQVTELPGVVSMPDNLKKFYPREAEQRGFEGDVVLRLLIDSDGSIAKVDVVSDPGQGLGAAGVRAIHSFRFRPGKLNGQPVATTITFTVHFYVTN